MTDMRETHDSTICVGRMTAMRGTHDGLAWKLHEGDMRGTHDRDAMGVGDLARALPVPEAMRWEHDRDAMGAWRGDGAKQEPCQPRN